MSRAKDFFLPLPSNCCTKNNEEYLFPRILVELAKTSPELVIPVFKKILLSRRPHWWRVAMMELIKIGQTSSAKLVTTIIKKALQCHYPYSLRYETMRIPIEVGKIYPKAVIKLFKSAFQMPQENIHWLTLHEIIELIPFRPCYFIPLLQEPLNSPFPHVQWMAMVTVIQLRDSYPNYIKPLLNNLMMTQYLAGEDTDKREVKKGRCKNKLSSKEIEKFTQRLQSNNAQIQWEAILKIAEIANHCPLESFPLLEFALKCQNLHVQWVATLTLLRLAKCFPQEIHPIFKRNFLVYEKLQLAPPRYKERLLILLGNDEIENVLPLFELGLQSNNYELQMLSLHELLLLHEGRPEAFVQALSKVFRCETHCATFSRIRLLAELGKTQSVLAVSLLKKVAKSEDKILQLVASRELSAVHACHNKAEKEEMITTMLTLPCCEHFSYGAQDDQVNT